MIDPSLDRETTSDDEISLLALGTTLLRWRRTIVALAILGGVLGLTLGLTGKRVYVSDATFIPQAPEGAGPSGLALAASQFGIRVPGSGSGWGPSGGGWGPPVYMQLLHSRALLEPVALDTFVVSEERGRRIALTDLLGVREPNPARRATRAVEALRKIVNASEVKDLGAVKLSVKTEWPSVSLALAERLVSGVNQFNLETRKSQAAAERQFVELQTAEAERALRAAEDRLQSFLQRNRETAGSPVLAFERERLQRDLALRQELHTSWMKSREEARIREVRDTPVITVFEDPKRPSEAQPRRSVQKAVLGGFAGAILGLLVAFLASGVSGARGTPDPNAREFFRLVEEATPRFLRRKKS